MLHRPVDSAAQSGCSGWSKADAQSSIKKQKADVELGHGCQRYTDAIVTYCETLQTFSLIGTRRDDVSPGLRITNYKSRAVIAFNVTAVFMLLFVVMLLFKAVYEFTEVNLLPGIDNAYWHDFTQAYVEGIYAQIASVMLVLGPTLWLIGAHWADRRRAPPPLVGSAESAG